MKQAVHHPFSSYKFLSPKNVKLIKPLHWTYIIFIGISKCATAVLRLFPCLMANVDGCKEGENHNKHQIDLKFWGFFFENPQEKMFTKKFSDTSFLSKSTILSNFCLAHFCLRGLYLDCLLWFFPFFAAMPTLAIRQGKSHKIVVTHCAQCRDFLERKPVLLE